MTSTLFDQSQAEAEANGVRERLSRFTPRQPSSLLRGAAEVAGVVIISVGFYQLAPPLGLTAIGGYLIWVANHQEV